VSRNARLKILKHELHALNMVQTMAEGLVVIATTGLGTETLQQFIEAVLPSAYVSFTE
jgi:hypothetical protein